MARRDPAEALGPELLLRGLERPALSDRLGLALDVPVQVVLEDLDVDDVGQADDPQGVGRRRVVLEYERAVHALPPFI